MPASHLIIKTMLRLRDAMCGVVANGWFALLSTASWSSGLDRTQSCSFCPLSAAGAGLQWEQRSPRQGLSSQRSHSSSHPGLTALSSVTSYAKKAWLQTRHLNHFLIKPENETKQTKPQHRTPKTKLSVFSVNYDPAQESTCSKALISRD